MMLNRASSAHVFLCLMAVCGMLHGQTGGSLSGVVTNPSGTAVSNAKVTVKNAATGQSVDVQSDPTGHYTVPNLAAGEYEVSTTADGFVAKAETVKLEAGAAQSLNIGLVVSTVPSLKDLGFAPGQTTGSAQEQARLDRRSHMLKIHQRMGLITLAPLVTTLILSSNAGGRNSTSSGRETHAVFGAVTAGLYFTTASFAVFAPKIPNMPTRGPIRIHKALAFVHGAGMILTPILGAMAYDQKNKGEKVHGIASAHGAVGAVTGIAYGAALLSVTIKF